MKIYDVVVIGGGPAGLMAAGSAAESGADVLLLEKMGSLGRKLLISGKGRCNITNTINNTKEMVGHFGKKGRFLYPAFNAFSNADTVKFFNKRGMSTRVDKGFKIFPESDMAEEVLSVLTRYIKDNNVDIRQGVIVKEIKIDGDNLCEVVLADGEVQCKTVVLAVGGKSYPKTGSSGDGYSYAKKLGHNIIEPKPSLVPVVLKEGFVKQLQGLSLRDCGFHIYKDGKKIAQDINDAVFTENGLSGPAVYNLTRMIDIKEKGLELLLDFMPEKDHKELDLLIADEAEKNARKMLKNLMEDFFSPKLLPVAMELSGVDGEMRAGNLSKKDRKEFVKILKSMKFSVERFAGFERAVVTSGGIDLKEIDGKTMMSKIADNLYFAGEVIDVDGPTGGYNLQVCWSTGRLAGISAAKKSLSMR
jgi:predicted Rossmann fold flavoprotein